jgi:hypothetical protein
LLLYALCALLFFTSVLEHAKMLHPAGGVLA